MKSLRASRSLAGRSGFTFLEIMLVVVIIGILAGLVGPRLVGKTKVAKVNATKQQINSIKTALSMYDMAAGGFPSSSEGLNALVQRPGSFSEADWPEKGFIDKVPKDAWGRDFQYTYPGQHGTDYDLVSSGPDGQPANADDVTNYEDAAEEGGQKP